MSRLPPVRTICSSRYAIRTGILFPREAELLVWCAEGKNIREAAMILGITHRSAECTLGRARERLNASSTCGAVATAFATGMMRPKNLH